MTAGGLNSIRVHIQIHFSKEMFTVKSFIFEMFLLCFVACNVFPRHWKMRGNSDLSRSSFGIHPSVHYLNQFSCWGKHLMKCWSQSRLSLIEKQCTPWTVGHFITGRTYRDRQPLAPVFNLESPINLISCLWPEYLEKSHTATDRKARSWLKLAMIISQTVLKLSSVAFCFVFYSLNNTTLNVKWNGICP